MQKIEGECLCGNIHYSGKTDVLLTAICHCKNCQKQGGASFSTNFAVAENSVNFSGNLSLYEDKGDSGKSVNRYFCNQCGSPLYSESEALAGLMILKAGTLDDSSWIKPDTAIYCDSAQPWVDLGNEIKNFPKMLES